MKPQVFKLYGSWWAFRLWRGHPLRRCGSWAEAIDQALNPRMPERFE